MSTNTENQMNAEKFLKLGSSMISALLIFIVPSSHATTLQDSFDAARLRSPEISQSLHLADKAKHDKRAALANVLPTFSAVTSLSRGHSSPGNVSSSYYKNSTSRINLEIPIYKPTNLAILSEREIDVSIAQTRLESQILSLISRTASVYFAVLTAQNDLSVLLSQRKSIQEQVSSARDRFHLGQAAITDIQETQARLDLNEAEIVSAEYVLLNRQHDFFQLTGTIPTDLMRLPETASLTDIPLLPGQELAQLLENSRLYHPDVVIASLIVGKTDTAIHQAKARHLPTVSLDSYSTLTRGSDALNPSPINRHKRDSAVIIQVSVPLYSGGGLSAQERSSLSSRDAAESALMAARDTAARKTREAYFALRSSIQQSRAFESAVQSAILALESTLMGYKAGVRTNIDVLDAQQQVADARRKLTNIRYEALSNHVKLKESTGKLSTADLAQLDKYLSAQTP